MMTTGTGSQRVIIDTIDAIVDQLGRWILDIEASVVSLSFSSVTRESN